MPTKADELEDLRYRRGANLNPSGGPGPDRELLADKKFEAGMDMSQAGRGGRQLQVS